MHYEPNVLVRDQRHQIERAKKVTVDAQNENATQSIVRQHAKKYLEKSERDLEARDRDRRLQEYRQYQEQ